MSAKSDYTLQPHEKYGFLQIKPTPTAEEINRFYASEFYSGDYKNFNNSSLEVQQADQEFWQGTWNDQARVIETLLARPINGLEILDVGCGWAQALLHFKTLGADCYGFDPAIEAVEYGVRQGLNLKHCGVESMDVFGGKQFDVVMLNNVLEHLAEPVAVLSQIRRQVLKPGGVLIVTVPNEFNKFQTAAQRLHNLEPWWVTPPAHLNYFSRTTLEAVLEGCGFATQQAMASFPLELFMLMGDNYVSDRELGRACHAKRVQFELNLRQLGEVETITQFYQALAQANLGRQITCYAKAV